MLFQNIVVLRAQLSHTLFAMTEQLNTVLWFGLILPVDYDSWEIDYTDNRITNYQQSSIVTTSRVSN